MSQNLWTSTTARDDLDVNKDVSIKLRITEDEHNAWRTAADSEGESLSNWIRRRCNGLPTTPPKTKIPQAGVVMTGKRVPRGKRPRTSRRPGGGRGSEL